MTQNDKQSVIIVIGIIAVIVLVIIAVVLSTGGRAGGTTSENKLLGQDLSSIRLLDKDSQPYSLAKLKGKKVVLFFNEGLMCYPACWSQVAAFGTDSRFNNDETVAISVVLDRSQDWQRAMEKMPELAQATLLFDANGAVSQQLELLTLPSSMHRGRLPGHTYVVLDKQGVVRYFYDDPTMAINNDLLLKKMAEW